MAEIPEELLQHICSYLRSSIPRARDRISSPQYDNVNLATLASFSLASKAFNRAARSSLYFALDIRESRIVLLRPFLSTITQQADAAACLHELYSDTFETERDVARGHVKPSPISEALLASYQASVARLAMSTNLKERLASALEKGIQDAELALLLCLCPNVRLWEMVAVHRVEETICMAVIGEAVAGGPSVNMPLQHLDQFLVSHWDTENATAMADLQVVLELPALTTFQGRMIACNDEQPLVLSQPTQLRLACFEDSLLDATGFESLLTHCSQLETLSVHWGSATVGAVEIDWISIGAAFQRHAKALQNLNLTPEEAFCLDGLGDAPGPLGDLRAMESLRMLSVPCDALVRDPVSLDENWLANRLPVSLQTLRLAKDNGEEDYDVEAMDAQLSRVMADSRFASLFTIRIERGEEFTGDIEELGWDASESNQYWVVLRRSSQT